MYCRYRLVIILALVLLLDTVHNGLVHLGLVVIATDAWNLRLLHACLEGPRKLRIRVTSRHG